MNILDFFIDPILRAPTVGSMLMCFSAALMGVLLFVRKQSLLGESLSHATYPGVTLAIVIATALNLEEFASVFILCGAFLSALLGCRLLHFLQSKLKLSSDASLCLVLAAFFGIGVTIASHVQFTHTHAFRQIQSYLYGQAATMDDRHIVLYATFSAITALFVTIFYKELQIFSFDRHYAKSMGIATRFIDGAILFLVVLSIVIGIRTVGVVLMSAMLIAPAVAARQLTHQLKGMFVYAGIFGLLSGFLGNFFSLYFSQKFSPLFANHRLSLPTGPIIVLIASSIATATLFFAPERGLVMRFIRVLRFRSQRVQENLLKQLWRKTSSGEAAIPYSEFLSFQNFSPLTLRFFLFRLWAKGWIQFEKNRHCALTKKGTVEGARIIRLHRLWEVYLVTQLGEGAEKVHHSAEEMEHILTPEMEKQLTVLLDNPRHDPHLQPIPSKDEVMSHG